LPASLAPRFDQHQFLCLTLLPGLFLSELLSRVDLQLLNIALHSLAQIENQIVAVSNLNGGRRDLPSSMPSWSLEQQTFVFVNQITFLSRFSVPLIPNTRNDGG
jgi:hypothetical protein